MTPAVLAAQKAGIEFATHEYKHDRNAASYGEEASAKLGVPAGTVFKTLVTQSETGELVVAIVAVCQSLDLKSAATALKFKKLKMADKGLVQRTTGYVLGGVSPLGQKKALRTVIDQSAMSYKKVHVSGGRRGLEIELAPGDLAQLCQATFADIAR